MEFTVETSLSAEALEQIHGAVESAPKAVRP
jgi:hypothetical protein